MSLPHALPDGLISLTSFGAAEVRRHGQLWFARLCAQAGAQGVEVREELLLTPQEAPVARAEQAELTELTELADWLRASGLHSVYSCPRPLFAGDGRLDAAALAHALQATGSLGAPWLKMSIGHFAAQSLAHSAQDLPLLAAPLAEAGVTLLIENDQTPQAGSLRALGRFFDAADAAGLQLPMTFDMGNWHYVGECPLQAARLLGARVGYIHAKGVQHAGKWVAVPLAQSSAPWRSLLDALPHQVPRAIEYPLIADDLLDYTRRELLALRLATAF